jgi:SAM-dependent methyltransferase
MPNFESVLVVGAGYDPYRFLFPRVKEYVRLDIKPIPGITDVVGDALALPFDAGRFDCILASEVMEHLSNPVLFAGEVTRVLKPSGTLVLTVPFLFHKHSDPCDYWRPTDQGVQELFNCFTSINVMPLGNALHVISDLVTTAYSPYSILFPLRILNHIIMLLPYNVIKRLPSMAPSGYLIVARK